ncbi:MAG: corrinoid protein, partial [Spirochaetes bacterium]|nr:corrinoid protein [Spirochaetota bacterium]
NGVNFLKRYEMTESEILGKLKESILIFDVELAEKSAQEAVNNDIDPLKAVEEGLVKGLDIIGEKYENDEIFLPELMMAANTFQTAMQILEPKISEKGQERAKKGIIVLGTVKGDIHKIGKDIVTLLFRTAGYEVHDLGEDVDLFTFIENAKKVNADAIGLSALLTSTLSGQKDVIDALIQEGMWDKYIIMVGGGATTPEWAETIGADLFAESAQAAVRRLTEMIAKKS